MAKVLNKRPVKKPAPRAGKSAAPTKRARPVIVTKKSLATKAKPAAKLIVKSAKSAIARMGKAINGVKTLAPPTKPSPGKASSKVIVAPPMKSSAPKLSPQKSLPEKSTATKSIIEKSVPVKSVAPSKPMPTKPVSARPLPPPMPILTPIPTDLKPRKNQAGMGSRELEHFRELLLAKRRELVGDMSSMESEALRSATGTNHSSLPMHMADQGTDNYEQEFTLGLVEKERQLLREINSALAKIQNGAFGICEGTGKPITKPRLEAQPWAKFSIEHARELERRQGHR